MPVNSTDIKNLYEKFKRSKLNSRTVSGTILKQDKISCSKNRKRNTEWDNCQTVGPWNVGCVPQ